MEEFLNQEEASSKRLAHGDIIDGVVVRVDPDEVLVDVGSKSEGVISSRELGPREAGTPDLHSGDHIKVFVLQPENEDGNVVLSLRRARAESLCGQASPRRRPKKGRTGDLVRGRGKPSERSGRRELIPRNLDVALKFPGARVRAGHT